MKSSSVLATALATHYGLNETTVAYGLKLTREDSDVFGFTSHDKSVSIDGVTYSAEQGLDASAIIVAAGTAVGNLELQTLNDGTFFTLNDILGGIWRNAAFVCFRYNWANTADGEEVLLTGNLGEFEIGETMLKVELRDLRQYINQDVGSLSSKNCRYRFGDSKCAVALGPITVTGSVTGVGAGNLSVVDTARTEVNDYFGNGEFQWTSGNNVGQRVLIKNYSSDTFNFQRPMFRTIQVGDTYSAIPGCRFRFDEDCKTKWNNALNFGGEPHRKGINDLTKAPE